MKYSLLVTALMLNAGLASCVAAPASNEALNKPAAARPVIRSLKKYHGKPGSGASVEFQIKEGPITMLSIGVNAQGKFKFILAEGESRRGPIPLTGNTNTHGFFGEDLRGFLKRWVKEGPTHHFALGIGHHAGTIEQIADCLSIECVIVR